MISTISTFAFPTTSFASQEIAFGQEATMQSPLGDPSQSDYSAPINTATTPKANPPPPHNNRDPWYKNPIFLACASVALGIGSGILIHGTDDDGYVPIAVFNSLIFTMLSTLGVAWDYEGSSK